MLLKFADDAKMLGKANNDVDISIVREDLNKLSEWSSNWQMSFNVDKCKVMHFGHRNSKAVYCINDTQLHDVQVERDLGVLVQSDMKVSQQCSNVVKTCNKILGLIYRSFTLKSKDAILSLYKALVRPRLEYCVHIL